MFFAETSRTILTIAGFGTFFGAGTVWPNVPPAAMHKSNMSRAISLFIIFRLMRYKFTFKAMVMQINLKILAFIDSFKGLSEISSF
jgi:hypothetical protein